MRRKHIGMAAKIVDKVVLKRERIEPATCLEIPGKLFGLRRETALRHVLFDHDDVVVML